MHLVCSTLLPTLCITMLMPPAPALRSSSITGTYSASPLTLKTVNGRISGTFTSSSASSPLRIETQNGALDGAWTGLGGIHASSSNGAIDAHCTVARKLQLKTANGAIGAKIEYLEDGVSALPKCEIEAATSNRKVSPSSAATGSHPVCFVPC